MKTVLVLAIITAAVPAAAEPQKRGDQMQAFDARRQGKLMPIREIERRVVPQMAGADYLGFEYDAGSGIYTLKFLRGGNVIWVDVDGRSGQVIGRTGALRSVKPRDSGVSVTAVVMLADAGTT